MLGSSLVKLLQKNHQVFSTSKSNLNLDFFNNYKQFNLQNKDYSSLLDWSEPDVIIHTAALTNVDFCENNEEIALDINAESVKRFLSYGDSSRFILISSDAVYQDGINLATESDETNPENIYGKSKKIAEEYIKNSGPLNLSIRTTILGKSINPKNKSFIDWVVESARNNKPINLFEDVIFSPITTWHLGEEIRWLLGSSLEGLINIAGRETISKFQIAKNICEGLCLPTEFLSPSKLEESNLFAKRSKDQTLDVTLYENISGRKLPDINKTLECLIKKFR